MSHDPKTKKCKGCGRVIKAGAYCSICRRARRARRASGMYRGKSANRVHRRRRGGVSFGLSARGSAYLATTGANGDYYAKPASEPNSTPEAQS